ncbi:MAG: Integrase, catalytic region [Bryobacterales bacterium]|nr:Integrase, catalytic region [Bryobacterales bacterium]
MGAVNQRLLLQCEYLAAENRILRSHFPARLRLSDPERSTLAEIGKRIGCKYLGEVACVAKPDTILVWYRRLIACKFDGSKSRSDPGRSRGETLLRDADSPQGSGELRLGLRSNRRRDYQPRSLHLRSDRREGPENATASQRRQSADRRLLEKRSSWRTWLSWPEPDFFTVEVLTCRRLVTYYVLFFLHLKTRRVARSMPPARSAHFALLRRPAGPKAER